MQRKNQIGAKPRTRRVLAGLLFVALLALASGPSGRAVANDVAGALRLGVTATLSSQRDPAEFADNLEFVLPRPAVPLTVEDAVAYELIQRSRTMATAEATRTASVLCEEARSLGYDPLLFVALIHVESFYDHYAISPVGAEGLMQLMPYTAAWMAEREHLAWPDGHSFDPELNVRLGARYLVHLHRQFRDMDHALTAYNRGPRATRYILGKYGKLPPHVREFYSDKVLQRYRTLRVTYAELPVL